MKGNVFPGVLLIASAAIICQISAMTANPILSRGKTVYTSSGNWNILTDDKFGPAWIVGNNSWLAINVGATYSKVFVNWNVPNSNWSDSLGRGGMSCVGGDKCPIDYTIQTSLNSTNGSDGTWTAALTITNNMVTSRGHLISNFNANWVKMNITKGAGSIDEFEVFDMSKNGTDIWFFPGTSISQMTYKANPPVQNFADLVTAAHPGFNPVMIRGGISCIYAKYIAYDITRYLNMTRDVKYWAIEMGTNDAYWGNTDSLAFFIKGMQIIIDSCKAAGIQPIIARLLATNPTAAGMTAPKWQVNMAFETVIDSLTKVNNLIAGPDLYTYFLNHPEEHNPDGIHPNPTGCASIQRLWAQKMDSLYNVKSAIESSGESIIAKSARNITLSSIKGQLKAHASSAGVLRLFSTNGVLFKTMKIPAAGTYSLPSGNGLCIARFSPKNNSEETLPIVLH